MRKKIYHWTFFFTLFFTALNAQLLKSIVYDFDGLDLNQVDLPEGDYRKGDMSTKVAANPLGQSDMLGDRVLQMNMAWNTGTGTFGRGISRYYEMNPANDQLNFYFYNPVTNPAEANVDVVIAEDDDQSNSYSINNDDTWKKNIKIQKQSGWQLISLPLNSFTDSNTGGNGIFDATFTGNKGMILMVEFRVLKNSTTNPVFYMDMIAFSEGNFPTGTSILNLPAPTMPQGKCPLGAFKQKSRGSEYLIPAEVEGYFPPSPVKHLKYVNFFLQWAEDGSTTPKELPGNEITQLLNNNYRPIITWEPMFLGYDRLDAVQPRLNNIINGNYNSYIDAFADKIKSYNDTVIIRLMHEFEGDWYSWSIVHNGEDPLRYANAYRTIVNRFRARGATKVKWMWCLNADYAPYRYFNFAINAYPGNEYVDIVATDVYNTHYPPELPWWMSFKYKIAETYYYLSKYVPNKPLMICELGSRERVSGESSSLQTKGQWLEKMDRELQTTFSRVKGLVFFSEFHTGDWRINSSQEALNSVTNNIWNDDYYFETSSSSTGTCSASGTITRDYWANVTGSSLSSVPFNSTPTSTSSLGSFEGPSSAGDNYGSRIRGYICPPTTGNYVFWIASDNQSELWISTDSTPQNKIKRAYVTAYTNAREWTKYTTQQSIPIALEAGKKYYIEALHREGTQGDNLAVGWQLPSGILERPIPGSRLAPFTSTTVVNPPPPQFTPAVFAVIADYGFAGSSELAVANLVKSWNPEFILTAGDNNYPRGSDTTIDANIGQYFKDYIYPYNGNYGAGGTVNRFWPALGNHEYMTQNAQPYFNYFTLPNNERYYDFVKGSVHFFVLNSDPSEPEGTSQTSVQAQWLQTKLQASTSKWKVVYFHHAPYTSDNIYAPGIQYMRWPFKTWGADIVLTGHAHIYERFNVNDFPYIVNGLGGYAKYNFSPSITPGSQIHYNAEYGALKVNVKTDTVLFRFYNINGTLIDSYPLVKTTTATPVCKATVKPLGSTYFCAGGSVTLQGPTGSGIAYQWKKNGSDIAGASGQNYTASNAGDYQLKISYPGCQDWSSPIKISITTTLSAKITADGPITFCNGQNVILYANTCGGYSYQWKKNGSDIVGATNNSYKAVSSGTYQLKVIQGSGAAWSSKLVVTVNNCTNAMERAPASADSLAFAAADEFKINVYPNPTTGLFTFQVCFDELEEETISYRVVSAVGAEVYHNPPRLVAGCLYENIELPSYLQGGIYILQILHNEKMESIKLLLLR